MIPPRSHAKGYERLNERVAARKEQARDDLRERRGSDEQEPLEDLVCPGCRQTFLQGSSCLECDLPLVGASMVDAWEPPAKDRPWLTVGIFVLVVLGGFVLMGLVL